MFIPGENRAIIVNLREKQLAKIFWFVIVQTDNLDFYCFKNNDSVIATKGLFELLQKTKNLVVT